MTVQNLRELDLTPALIDQAERLKSYAAGLVLTSGQARSGRLTTLMGLVASLADAKPDVVILRGASSAMMDAFRPWPTGWREVEVEDVVEKWTEAIAGVPRTSLLVVTDLRFSNARAAVAASLSRLVFASIESPLVGLDVAYALRQLDVSYEAFIVSIRCIWSQLLLGAACQQCARREILSAEEAAFLFPLEKPPEDLLREVGCSVCGESGTKGLHAVVDAILVDEEWRDALRKIVLEDLPVPLPRHVHLAMHDQARHRLASLQIGLSAYRDLIRRNPLLRAQNAIEREQAYSNRLGLMFQKFVSPEVQRRLMSTRGLANVVRGEARQVSCLFCDIRGFTARAESRTPEQLFAELNRYFAVVVEAVLENDGTIDKFIGDAVMVVFGAPLDQPDHAHRAMRCALTIRRRIDAFNEVDAAYSPILTGIGINSGAAIAGCIGTDARMDYTVLGDTINVAARLESRAAPRQILISSATQDSAGPGFQTRHVGKMELRGRKAGTEVFELLS